MVEVVEAPAAPPLGAERRVTYIERSAMLPDNFASDPAKSPELLSLFVELEGGEEDWAQLNPADVATVSDLEFVTGWSWDSPALAEQALELVAKHREEVEDAALGEYFEGRAFYPARLAADVETGTTIRMGHDHRLWRRNGGAYLPDGEQLVRFRSRRLLGEAARSGQVNETVRHFVDLTAIDPLPEAPPYEEVFTPLGAVNWRTGERRPAGPETASAVMVPVELRGGECPAFVKFLSEVLPGDGMEEFVFELFGYCLLARNPLHKAFIFVGPGRNGKSVLLRVLRTMLGARNCASISLHDLEESRFASASLFGKLANICGDIDSRELRSTSKFKQITGEDPISAEHKGKDRFDFTSFATLIFSANQAPTAKDSSYAYFSRVVIIPFTRTFSESEADRGLVHALTSADELSGILTRSIEGLRRLMDRGYFDLPASVVAAGDNYRAESDTAMRYVTEVLDVDAGLSVKKADAYAGYADWCKKSGHFPQERGRFYDALRALPGVAETQRRFDGVGVAPLNSP